MIHILLVDDHAAFRQPLAFLLARHRDRLLVTQAGTLVEGQRHLHEVDLAVVDSDLPDGVGEDLIRALRSVSPQTRVVALVPANPCEPVLTSLEANADAIVSKAAGLDELLGTLAQVTAEVSQRP